MARSHATHRISKTGFISGPLQPRFRGSYLAKSVHNLTQERPTAPSTDLAQKHPHPHTPKFWSLGPSHPATCGVGWHATQLLAFWGGSEKPSIFVNFLKIAWGVRWRVGIGMRHGTGTFGSGQDRMIGFFFRSGQRRKIGSSVWEYFL